jgi:hypothetical protein
VQRIASPNGSTLMPFSSFLSFWFFGFLYLTQARLQAARNGLTIVQFSNKFLLIIIIIIIICLEELACVLYMDFKDTNP